MEISTNDLQELTTFNQEEDLLSEERLQKISTSSLTNLQKSSFKNGHRSFSNLLPRTGANGGQKSPVKSLTEHQKPLEQKADDHDSITEKLNAISGYSRSLPNFSKTKTRSFSTLLQRNVDKSTTISTVKTSFSEIPEITLTDTASKVTKAIITTHDDEEPLNEKLEAISSTSESTYKKPAMTPAGKRNFTTLLKSNDKFSSDKKTDDMESKNVPDSDGTLGKKGAQKVTQ